MQSNIRLINFLFELRFGDTGGIFFELGFMRLIAQLSLAFIQGDDLIGLDTSECLDCAIGPTYENLVSRGCGSETKMNAGVVTGEKAVSWRNQSLDLSLTSFYGNLCADGVPFQGRVHRSNNEPIAFLLESVKK